ncbi:MAG: acyl-CoA dehydrogenase [Alphaproteobacteria bacterium]|nr:acyl-CoA dehydrogenase [Alphaproteobacteria bacterium]
MFRQDSDQEKAFRAEVRTWFAANLPDEIRDRTHRLPPDKMKPWWKKVYERGWAGPHWPKEHGGMGATLNEQIILLEETARAGAPTLHGPGLTFLAPTIMEFGTPAHKARHLPKILSGECYWAQGYSEPGSGSDLASLSCRAELRGDHFVVNGQKIWNTHAHYADWMFTLVRTDPEAKPKHAGISMLLIDLRTPGVTPRGINTISGDDELCTVFLDDVKVPKEHLLGPLNGGWKVANFVLNFERFNQSSPVAVNIAMERVKRTARATGAMNDPSFRDRLAKVEIDLLTQAALYTHAVDLTNAGRILGPEASIMKITGTENLQRVVDLLIEAAGGNGADLERFDTPEGSVDVTGLFLLHRRATIYGGSNEIQRNVIARRVLALPG